MKARWFSQWPCCWSEFEVHDTLQKNCITNVAKKTRKIKECWCPNSPLKNYLPTCLPLKKDRIISPSCNSSPVVFLLNILRSSIVRTGVMQFNCTANRFGHVSHFTANYPSYIRLHLHVNPFKKKFNNKKWQQIEVRWLWSLWPDLFGQILHEWMIGR